MSGKICSATCLVVLCVACIALTSCSEVEALKTTNATLEGTVTYQGNPVPYALVIAASSGGEGSATANADADGKYSMTNVPVGAVNIAVNTGPAKGIAMAKSMSKQKGGKAGSSPKLVDVPDKFFKPETSGITTNVVEGPNTFNVELK